MAEEYYWLMSVLCFAGFERVLCVAVRRSLLRLPRVSSSDRGGDEEGPTAAPPLPALRPGDAAASIQADLAGLPITQVHPLI